MGPHGSGHAPCIPPKTHANVGCLNTQSLLPPAASSNDETHEQKHRLSARFSPLGSTKTVPKLGGCTARWLFSNKAVLDCKRCHKQLYILNILLYIHKARVQAYLPLYTIIYIYMDCFCFNTFEHPAFSVKRTNTVGIPPWCLVVFAFHCLFFQ